MNGTLRNSLETQRKHGENDTGKLNDIQRNFTRANIRDILAPHRTCALHKKGTTGIRGNLIGTPGANDMA